MELEQADRQQGWSSRHDHIFDQDRPTAGERRTLIVVAITAVTGGYVIRLPSSGTIRYTDKTVPTAGGAQLGPFHAEKSVWTIEVERLP